MTRGTFGFDVRQERTAQLTERGSIPRCSIGLTQEQDMTTDLIKLDQANKMLAEIHTIDDAKELINLAEAARVYARQVDLGYKAQNHAAEIKLRAQRKGGELLQGMDKARGTVFDGRDEAGNFRRLEAPTAERTPTYAEIGIDKHAAYNWQTIAKFPAGDFETHIAKAWSAGRELTTTNLVRVAKRYVLANAPRPEPRTYLDNGSKIIIGDARDMDLSQFDRYGAIVADPPWPYRVAKGQGIAEDQYGVMSEDDLCAMPVADLALDDCVLFLWGTWPKLPEVLMVMGAWGFEYVTGFPWVKTTSGGEVSYGVGYWVRGASEFVLIGRKGHVSAPRLSGFMGLLSPNLQHSRKPDSVHIIAEAMDGPYLELFARRARPGWTVFGNEIQGVMV